MFLNVDSNLDVQFQDHLNNEISPFDFESKPPSPNDSKPHSPDEMNASMRSRNSHRSEQKKRLSRNSSPSKLILNENSFRDPGEVDFKNMQFDFNEEEEEGIPDEHDDMFGLGKIIKQSQMEEQVREDQIQQQQYQDELSGRIIQQMEVKKIKQVQFTESPLKSKINQSPERIQKYMKTPQKDQSPGSNLQNFNLITSKNNKKVQSLSNVEIVPIVWKQVEIIDLKTFLLTPVNEGRILQCHIERDSSGMGFFYPKYHLYISESRTYLMTVKRMAAQKTSKYIMSFDMNDHSSKSPKFLGIIRSNFLGTEFMIYDNGENPKLNNDYQLLRSQLGLINYTSSSLLTQAPRKFRVVLPAIINNIPLLYKPLLSREGLILESTLPEKRDVTYHEFQNKKPIWDSKRNGFTMRFTERVNKTSVKNFQLQKINKTGLPVERQVFQFGRFGESDFNLDFQYPFSPLQAFAMAITTFDTKIACD